MKAKEIAKVLENFDDHTLITSMFYATNDIKCIVYCEADEVVILTDDAEFVIEIIIIEKNYTRENFVVWRSK